MKKLFTKCLCALTVFAGLTIAGCKDSGVDETTQFAISSFSGEHYAISVANSAAAGDEVKVEVKVTDPAFHVTHVFANDVPCKKVSDIENGGIYSFVMPAEAVTIVADVAHNAYGISYDDNSAYTVEGPDTASVGDIVDFTVTMANPARKISAAKANDIECTLLSVNEETSLYTFRFTMPAANVTVTLEVGLDRHIITPIQGEHSVLTMLNCCDNWDAKPEERIFDEVVDKPVKFLYSAELGYTVEIKAISASGTVLDVVYDDKDPDFGECWTCIMPDEDITLETIATEKTDYKGKAFVGTYKGYEVKVADGQLFSASTPVLNFTLNYNTSFYLTSTDANAFNFDGCYSFNESQNRFAYIHEYSDDGYGRPDYGLSGQWFANGDVFAYISDILEDKPENTKFYFASTVDFEYACAASDTYGMRYLVELSRNGSKSWYFIQKQELKATAVTLQFTSGASIADAASALVLNGGEAIYRYDHKADNAPIFTARGTEAGSYTSADSASQPALVLDGFGSATIGETNGTYTIDGNLLTLTAGSETRTFQLDKQNKTYSEIRNDAWEGPKQFALESANGGIYDGSACAVKIKLVLDCDYEGNESKGTAKFTVDLGEKTGAIGSTPSYVYNALTKKLTLSGILVGKANGLATERIDIALTASNDLKSLTCADDVVLRATSGGDSRYFNFKNQTLTEFTPAAAEWDGKTDFRKSVNPKFDGGNSFGLLVIKLNSDKSGNTAKGSAWVNLYAMSLVDYSNVYYIDCTASYSFDTTAKTLTISDIEVGKADGSGTEKTSVTFSYNDKKDEITYTGDAILRATEKGDTRFLTLKGTTLSAY